MFSKRTITLIAIFFITISQSRITYYRVSATGDGDMTGSMDNNVYGNFNMIRGTNNGAMGNNNMILGHSNGLMGDQN